MISIHRNSGFNINWIIRNFLIKCSLVENQCTELEIARSGNTKISGVTANHTQGKRLTGESSCATESAILAVVDHVV